MTITQALKAARGAPRDAALYTVTLACGFTPLHLRTFVAAHLQEQLRDRRVEVEVGLYGDLPGTLSNIGRTPVHAVAVALEWADLDARLGFRSAGAWGPAVVSDIAESVRSSLSLLSAAILRAPAGLRIALSLPTLPVAPLFHTPGWTLSETEFLLERYLLDFVAAVTPRVAVLNRQWLDAVSPPNSRLDLKSDLLLGLPYSLSHADALGDGLARLLAPAVPKKGIITDLDNTLWLGIVGEAGAEQISWDLAGHGQIHGLYQNLLSSLAQEGVLLAIASKNSPETVTNALRRSDLLLKPEKVFPIEVHWNAKSGSVARILKTWNISADSVIFVDDSPMELAEVAAANPGIECLRFPENDPGAAHELFRRLRNLCGRESLSADDALRLQSIRQGEAFRSDLEQGASPEAFLRDAGALIRFDLRRDPANRRALELINKTNQFNLNGRRYTEPDWDRALTSPSSVLMAAAYEDKFGPLGTIAVLLGSYENGILSVDSWVMSCRAFARRIEWQCLRFLFDRYPVESISFQFQQTSKNGPLQEYFSMVSGQSPGAPFELTRSAFDSVCPMLYHEVGVVAPDS